MTELEVPPDAMSTWWTCHTTDRHDADEQCVRAIAAPVVAAELRALAGDMHQPWDAAVLRRRAELIEGGFS